MSTSKPDITDTTPDSEKGCGPGCILLFLSPFTFAVGTYLPLATIWSWGEWYKDDEGYHFESYPGEDYSLLLILIYAGLLFVLSKALNIFLDSRTVKAVNKKYLRLAQGKPNLEFWSSFLAGGWETVLWDYHSDQEVESARREARFLLPGMALLLGGPLVAWPVYFLFDAALESGMTLARVLPILGLYGLGGYLVSHAIKVSRSQLKRDDRLLIDFEKKEIQTIEMHNIVAKPETWVRFEEFNSLTLKTIELESGEAYSLELKVPVRDKPLKLLSMQRRNCEVVARQLAELFGIDLSGDGNDFLYLTKS